uniref:Thioredoxin domain-containing protein 17 n=1 Tax=Myxobolus squamalis TaxID=59785 RepID=A0A6B2G487_MYXSQ
MPIIEVDDFESLQSELKKCSEKRKYVLFESGIDPISGIFWCPDCVKFDSIITSAVENLPNNKILIRFNVGSRKQWKNPSNPLRHGAFMGVHITSIPFLVNTQNNAHFSSCEKMTIKEVEDILSS